MVDIRKIYKNATVEMFKRVGLDLTYLQIVDYTKQNGAEWYTTKEWSSKEQEDFKTWLSMKLQKARPGFSDVYYQNQAAWFLLDIGWKTTEG